MIATMSELVQIDGGTDYHLSFPCGIDPILLTPFPSRGRGKILLRGALAPLKHPGE